MRRFVPLALFASFIASGAVNAQSIVGTYTTRNPQGGTVTFTLQPSGSGKVTGSLSGNGSSFQAMGTMGDDAADGTLSGSGVNMFFSARVQGDNLELTLIEPDRNGQPNFQRATRLNFQRQAGASTGAAAPAASGGNPLGRGGAASADKYGGSWTSRDVQLALNGSGGTYSGQLTHQGRTYPVSLKDEGPGLSGTFTSDGQKYELLVKVENGSLMLNTAGTTYMLVRGGGATASRNPLGGGASQAASSGAAAGSGGAGGMGLNNPRMSPQDRQMAELLTRNGWCAFSYKSSSTYSTNSDRSSWERVVLYPDGRATSGSTSESYNSGASGQVYGNGGDGQQGFWKFEGGQFFASADGTNWVPTPFKMTFNSNNAPIPIVNGREYMICR